MRGARDASNSSLSLKKERKSRDACACAFCVDARTKTQSVARQIYNDFEKTTRRPLKRLQKK